MFKLLRLTGLMMGLLELIIAALVILVRGDATPPIPWIAFISDRNGFLDIYRMRADGRVQQRLTTSPEPDSDPQWSPPLERSGHPWRALVIGGEMVAAALAPAVRNRRCLAA